MEIEIPKDLTQEQEKKFIKIANRVIKQFAEVEHLYFHPEETKFLTKKDDWKRLARNAVKMYCRSDQTDLWKGTYIACAHLYRFMKISKDVGISKKPIRDWLKAQLRDIKYRPVDRLIQTSQSKEELSPVTQTQQGLLFNT